jgi:4-hydroxythreonine-4-phosphate dehydrogenase
MIKPRLALSIGDSAGIGPEIIVRAFTSGEILNYSRPIVIGKAAPLNRAIKLIKAGSKIHKIGNIGEARFRRGFIDLIEIEEVRLGKFSWGRVNLGCARLSIRAVEKAVAMALKREVEGIVTLPINKKGWEMAGSRFPGHTEFLAYLTGTKEFAMLLRGGRIKVLLVTRHIALKEVAGAINKKEVFKNIILAQKGCLSLGIKNPRIAVAGLNPHAGEGGLLGREEREKIRPAIRQARLKGLDVSGPYPADSLFYRVNKGDFDIVVAMYHDQGLIPLKMFSMEKSVNVTIGLPLIRTSPGHGTAYDIAGKGVARETSLIEAVKVAARMVCYEKDSASTCSRIKI